MKNKLVLIFLWLVIIFLITESQQKKEAFRFLEAFNVDAQTEQEMKDEVIIAAFISDIRARVEKFYMYNYDKKITVYDYETDILNIEKKEPRLIQIKFGTIPQVGAHNPIGYDELVYTIDAEGKRKFVDYQHGES